MTTQDVFLFHHGADEAVLATLTQRLADAGLNPRRDLHLTLSPPLLERLRKGLVQCAAFDSDSALRAACVDARLEPWRESLPHASDPAARVQSVIDFLQNRFTNAQENALALLLRILADQVPPADAQHAQLLTLARDVELAVVLEALSAAATTLVCIGRAGAPRVEVFRAALAQVPESRVLPVLLPGATREIVPDFLSAHEAVQFTRTLDEPDAWAHLVRLLRETPPPPADADCPYRGLEYFDVAHAHLFFGREALTEKLLERLAERRFLAIIGPSGSGKSSVARAGLLYRLQQAALPGSADWRVVIVTPTAAPLDRLAVGLRPVLSGLGPTAIYKDLQAAERGLHLLAQMDAPPLLVCVDQFEEVFTLCRAEDERRQYLDNLLYAVARADGNTRVVLTMRADFYGKCAAYPTLAEWLERSQVLVGPLSDDEVRRAIELPAARAGLELEAGLTDQMVSDVREQPGNLPLLQYALRELWLAREGHCLTLRAYVATGKVQGALARRADVIYAALSAPEQHLTRDILLRLTELGEGTEDTRRRAPKAELTSLQAAADSAPTQVETVLRRLADERLITTSRDATTGAEWVDVAHEALIRGWPRLQAWLAEDRASLRQHRQLTEAAREWAAHTRDDDYLFRGGRLAAAREWLDSAPAVNLTIEERAFIDSSVAAEQQRLEAERNRRRRWRISVAAAFTIISALAVISLIFGLRSTQQAGDLLVAQQTAVAGEAAALRSQAEAEYQARAALARQLANTASIYSPRDLQLTLLLAQEAIFATYTTDDYVTLEASTILRSVLVKEDYELFAVMTYTYTARLGHKLPIYSAAYSPDGKHIITASRDKTARVWDVTTGRELLVLKGHQWDVLNAAYSPDGARIVTASSDNTARVWDAATGEIVLAGAAVGIHSAAYSPDEARIVTASGDNTARVWDAGSTR